MTVSVAATLPRNAEHVGVARELVATGLRRFRAPDEVVDEMRVVVSEASSNVVRHAGGCDDYQVTVDLDEGVVEVSVSCAGEQFDAGAAMPEALAQSGRGIALMTELTDAVTVATTRVAQPSGSPDAGSGPPPPLYAAPLTRSRTNATTSSTLSTPLWKNAAAPHSSAISTTDRSSEDENMTTTPGAASRMSGSADRPSRTGIPWSSTTASDCCSRA